MATKLVNGKRIALSPQENAAWTAEKVQDLLEQREQALVAKREILMQDARDKAIEALVSTERANIMSMNETALDVAIAALG